MGLSTGIEDANPVGDINGDGLVDFVFGGNAVVFSRPKGSRFPAVLDPSKLNGSNGFVFTGPEFVDGASWISPWGTSTVTALWIFFSEYTWFSAGRRAPRFPPFWTPPAWTGAMALILAASTGVFRRLGTSTMTASWISLSGRSRGATSLRAMWFSADRRA